MIISMVLGYALLFIGVGLFNQGWGCASFTARVGKVGSSPTLYALVRHPQNSRPFPRGETVFSLASAVRQMRELLVLKLFLEERQRAFYWVRRTVLGVVSSR
jgi:hypothetical protein